MAKKLIAPEVVAGEVSGVLESHVVFEGNLAFSGTFHVNGMIKGKVSTPDTLIIGETGRVDGEISAGVVVIYGRVEARVHARHRVEVKKPAVFRGEMMTPSLQVEEGVIFEGSNRMI